MLLCERKSKTNGSKITWREKLAAQSGLAVMLAKQDQEHPRSGHPGGDTREAHTLHVENLHRLLNEMTELEVPLPAQRRHPTKPCYRKIAENIGASVESFRIGSELRAIVDKAAPVLGLAPMIREDDGEILLAQVLEAAVTAVRRERLIDGAPAEHEVNALKRTAWLAARTLRGDLSLPAARALESLRACVDEGKVRIPRFGGAALRRLEALYADLLDSDGLPEDFAGALSALNAQTGLSLTLAAKMVGMNPQTLANWARGRKVPDRSKWHFVAALEQLYKVEAGELIGRIRTMRKGRARFAQKFYPPQLRGIEHVRRRSRISPLLPTSFETLSEDDRYAAVARAEERINDEDAERQKRGSLMVKEQRYGLSELPKGFDADFAAMATFRESIAGTGMMTGKRWTRVTSDIWHNHMLEFCGFIVSEHAGALRVAPERLDFRIFMNPATVDAFIGFRLDRARAAGKSDKPSDVDIEHLSFAGAMFDKAGWLRQLPDFARRVGMSASKWAEKCKELQQRYRELASDRRKNRRIPAHERTGSRDEGYGGALPVLKLKRPMEPIFRLIAVMQAEFNVMIEQAAKKAGTCQDIVWAQLQAQLALRPRTWSKVEWRPDNRGHLRKDAQGWYVDIPRECFKNRESRALAEGFVHRVRDVDGLYANLEKYLSVHRFAVVQGMKTNLLFVYGRKGLNIDGTPMPSKRRNYRPYEAGLANAVRRFVSRHIGLEADPANRVEGLRTFSPCAFRHILATSIVKATGRCDLAADAIGDTEEIARKYYQRFLPSDRRESLEAAREEVFSAGLPKITATASTAATGSDRKRTSLQGRGARPATAKHQTARGVAGRKRGGRHDRDRTPATKQHHHLGGLM